MTKQSPKDLPVNLKEQNAVHSFRVVIRDREHFYSLVNWLNNNVGRGAKKWTMEGRVLKTIKQGKTVNPLIYIFTPDFDIASTVYLTLI